VGEKTNRTGGEAFGLRFPLEVGYFLGRLLGAIELSDCARPRWAWVWIPRDDHDRDGR
jgi:hypothetical protein